LALKRVEWLAGLVFLPALILLAVRPALSQEPVPEPTTTPESWLILPELPADATQADVGAEVYELVCQDCHGNRGQGLTEDWIATWDPDDQNCWQSKCHAGPIPRGGFALPRVVPAIVGADTLSRFETAHALYDFIRQNMPWHKPGSLQDYEYMQLTAFLLRENGLGADDTPLDEATAAGLLLHPERAAETPVPEADPTPAAVGPARFSLWYGVAIAAVAGFGLLLALRLYRSR
jgi:hypothetical protein